MLRECRPASSSALPGPLSTTHVPVCACFLERSQPQKESQPAAVTYLSPLKLYPLWGASRAHTPCHRHQWTCGPDPDPEANDQGHPLASILEGHPELPQSTFGPGPQGPQMRPSEGVARPQVYTCYTSGLTACGTAS